MKVAIVGAGPAGLYLAILLQQADRGHDVARPRAQRARRDVRLRRRVLRGDARARCATPTRDRTSEITDTFARWTTIDIHYRGAS